MRKALLLSTIPLVLAVSACQPTDQKPTPSPVSNIAQAPLAEDQKNMMREWHKAGGDRVLVPLVADLELSEEDWRSDEFKRKGLAEAVKKDTKAAMGYRPVPDAECQRYWVQFVTTMQKVDQNMDQGNWDQANQGLKDAENIYKKFYDRNQAIFSS